MGNNLKISVPNIRGLVLKNSLNFVLKKSYVQIKMLILLSNKRYEYLEHDFKHVLSLGENTSC